MFGSISKWCAEINSVDRIPEYIAKAYNLAVSGRPGPIVLSIPENILCQTTEISNVALTPYFEPAPDKNCKELLQNVLTKSLKPIILVGGPYWSEKTRSNVNRFANRHSIPVLSGFRRQDLFDNTSEVFCGALGTSVSHSLLQSREGNGTLATPVSGSSAYLHSLNTEWQMSSTTLMTAFGTHEYQARDPICSRAHFFLDSSQIVAVAVVVVVGQMTLLRS